MNLHAPHLVSQRYLPRILGYGLITAGVVFLGCLFGILTRPSGFLSSFWPANAILIALMVRAPHLAHPAGWIGATIGYLAADLLTGGGLVLTVWLTIGNLANAMLCVWLFGIIDPADRELRRPTSLTYLLAICACGAMLGTAVGAGALIKFFGTEPFRAFVTYFVTELGNSLIALPLALSAPAPREWLRFGRRGSDMKPVRRGHPALPILALLASLVLGEAIGGPGKVVISIPAIIWCALTYQFFVTSALMFLIGLWHCILLPPDIRLGQSAFIDSIISIRLALGLLALVPMAVALSSSAYDELVSNLKQAASQDLLTNAMSRNAFLQDAELALADAAPGKAATAMLMIDVDHFKTINDRFGHAAGDATLAAIGATVSGLLRRNDLFGRLGGEEFAVLLHTVTPEDAKAVADRIRTACEAIRLTWDAGTTISVTVSIGIAIARKPRQDLNALLKLADQALYVAKRNGRNRTVMWSPVLAA